MTPPQPRCLRALLLLLLLLGLASTAILVPWWMQMTAYQERTDELRARWQRFQALNARRSGLEARLQQITERERKDKYYIDAATPAVAAAGLQKQVKQAVEASGGDLVSTQNLPQAAEKGHQKVAIRVRMKSDVAALAEILHRLEGGRPLLFVDNLSIRARRSYRRRGKQRPSQGELDVRFDLSGYLKEGG